MDMLMQATHLLKLDGRLAALVDDVDAAGRSGRSWLATWRAIAPRLLAITGTQAEHPRLRSREAFPVLKEHLLLVWLRGSNPGPLPSCEWAEDDARHQAEGDTPRSGSSIGVPSR